MKTMLMACLAFAIALIASTSNAQTAKANRLFGLKSLAVVVENLDDDATKCGIIKQELETSLRFILGQSNIKIVALEDILISDGYIYLNVNVLTNCARNVILEVDTLVTIKKTGRTEMAAVWNGGGIGTGGDARSSTKDSVETYAKMLVNDWNSVNR